MIVGGGSVDLDLLRDLYLSGAHLVGADGGADQIVAAGLKPEAIIGDFDSLTNADTWLGRTRLMRLSEQETTDFEKALYSTSAPVTVALGMTGKRFDHTLAALDAVTKYGKERVIILVDEADIAVAMTGPFSFEVTPRERVSVHPLAADPVQAERGPQISAQRREAGAGRADRHVERSDRRAVPDRARGQGKAVAAGARPEVSVWGGRGGDGDGWVATRRD